MLCAIGGLLGYHILYLLYRDLTTNEHLKGRLATLPVNPYTKPKNRLLARFGNPISYVPLRPFSSRLAHAVKVTPEGIDHNSLRLNWNKSELESDSH